MKQFKYNRSESCAFTGHRNIAQGDIRLLRNSLKETVEQCYEEGITNFVSGMAVGFDMLAAEVVLALRDEHPDITLTAIVPFHGQELRWNETNKRRYDHILDEADQVIVLSKTFFKGAEMKRNAYMVEHACRLIAYFNGEEHGGTYFTCSKAKEQGLSITNLFQRL